MPRPPDLLNLLAWLAGLWLAAVVVLLGLHFGTTAVRLHWTTIVYFAATLACSAIVFPLFAIDKYRAGTGGRRTAESVLHLFELLGGWPGSLLAQRTFRHKNRKIAYQAVFWVIVGGHLVLLLWLLIMWWQSPPREPPPEPVPAEATEPAAE